MCTVERKMRTDYEWKHNYCKKQSLSVCFFVFFSAATFLLWFGGLYKFSVPFSLSVQVPRVSNWFWQTMFLLHAKTWFVKIKWRHGELELIVKREQRFCASPQIIAKSGCPFVLFLLFFPVGWVSTGTLSARCFFLVGSSARLVLPAPR